MLRSEVEILMDLPLFQGLSTAEMDEVLRHINRRSYPARIEILKENQRTRRVHILLRGGVKVFVARPDGMEMLLTILGRGEVLGELSAIDDLPHSAGVMTLEPTEIAWIDGLAFSHMLQTMPSLSFNMVKILSHRLRRVTGQAQALATLDVGGRVARQLLLFGEQYGDPQPGGAVLIPLRIKQGDLAGMVGASREKVNRILKFLKSQGHISVNAQNYTILHHLDALDKMVR